MGKRKKHLNATILTIIMLGIGFQIAFSRSVILNVVVTFICLLYLLYCQVLLRKVLIMLLLAFPLAFGSWWSFIMFGTGDTWHSAWIYGSRVYAYLLLGSMLTLTVPVKEILISLSIHIKLSETFVYGLLASFNLLPRIRQQFKLIQYSAQMRGKSYRPWQPALYLRIIIVALHWSEDLAEAMSSQGFSEGFPRTRTFNDPLPRWQWGFAIIVIMLYFSAAFLVSPW
ncbi:transmembrane component [Liquorilactobacillus sucicola DSM 21376 = JCM 15457]|uniref:ABC transporter permease n=1 Tax=Liquorilactobacillus sucicola DSM 21376 = JCM 15457 TaxID=1423806 RepID=A0A023CX37_9LACO|nr:energy-coupling factor transporter transmembrane component T [Liquorilactobacillus sucicola]KRN06976.1 ABC transporter permease [Liquorilactobacillus sucicola DSM 21376 = JCM 15457]GAJ26458.1 transmembrane component [Liquorilactobacillus sucicola DSM 21376 = JCM 15457]